MRMHEAVGKTCSLFTSIKTRAYILILSSSLFVTLKDVEDTAYINDIFTLLVNLLLVRKRPRSMRLNVETDVNRGT